MFGSNIPSVMTVTIVLGWSSVALGDKPIPAQKAEDVTLDAKDFQRSTAIDNKWLPMTPGMRWTYEGHAREHDGKIVSHKTIITITDLTKTLSGVKAIVSYDLDYSDDELVEAELAFFAQDNDGNVWHLGQYPEEYEDGKFTKAPAWIHGFQGAHAGLTMMADPRLGTPSYSEGWGPAVNWTDRGIVYQTGQTITVRAGTFDNVLVIKERAAREQEAEQLKYYAAGMGNIRTGWLGSGDQATEDLALVKREQLTPRELSDLRGKALRLEADAYKRSREVYGKTSPSVMESNSGKAAQ
jgi:hypothetical protein